MAKSSYWVKYKWLNDGREWEIESAFPTVGESEDHNTLESWWIEESNGGYVHEILEVVKL